MISNVPIVTSACLQVPRDTRRPPGRLEFHLSAVISAVCYLLGHIMYLRRGSTANTLFFGHHRSRESRLWRSSPSPHRTAGGLRKLVLGVASAMGTTRACSFPPPSPPSAPTEICTKNSVELKDILHAEPRNHHGGTGLVFLAWGDQRTNPGE